KAIQTGRQSPVFGVGTHTHIRSHLLCGLPVVLLFQHGLSAGQGLSQLGVFGSQDAALVFDAIKGYDKKDHTSHKDTPATPVADKLNGSVKGKKIGVAKEYFEDLNSGIKNAVYRAIAHYESEGAKIVEVELPLLKYAVPVYYILACAEASSNLGRYDGIRYGFRTEKYTDINDMIMRTRSEGFGKEVQRRIMLGTYVLSSGYFDAYYKKAQLLRNQVISSFDTLFAKCDALIAPIAPRTAFPLKYASDNIIETYLSDIYTVPVNIAGLPALSLPCGKDEKGLPIGMQLIGKQFAEETILNLAANFERSGLAGVVPLSKGVRL
ncbi:MAG: Asp-tRNA(Asn)/Glu-tRNA(Gln) amidotransferase subunit GatA, partial [Clostridia bacterium]|nr:Asp-tRNA(Asn)/Glu-tRNA(Gln) amidotransferase subunit GatA [Clostridia bacterium]